MARLAILIGLLAVFSSIGPLRAEGLNLVMVEQTGCSWCAAWHREIGPAYPNTDEGRAAPLRTVDLHALPPDLDLVSQPRFTPTFLLIYNGREIGRLEGYPGADFFWPMLARMLEAAPETMKVEETQ